MTRMFNAQLPKPTDHLAGCIWLPRFAAKVRMYAAGQLGADYEIAFCHPRGVDGRFLAHFGLDKAGAIEAIMKTTQDRELAHWFTALPTVTDKSIREWNEFAPLIGRPGQPGERELAFMLRRTYPDGAPPVPLTSAFDAILWDERPAK